VQRYQARGAKVTETFPSNTARKNAEKTDRRGGTAADLVPT